MNPYRPNSNGVNLQVELWMVGKAFHLGRSVGMPLLGAVVTINPARSAVP
ncbi:hypothetical protein [uncultured Tateyamaria sp.]|nr:hypothetical protein [uncultured Tateyamaria sp.]